MTTLRLVHYVHPYGTFLLFPVGVEKKGWAAPTAGGVGGWRNIPSQKLQWEVIC